MNKYDNELDYLLKSLDVVNEGHTSALKQLRQNKEEQASLQVDTPNITNKKLQDAAMKTFNFFTVENSKLSGNIKTIREDQKWIKRLIVIVQKYFKEGSK